MLKNIFVKNKLLSKFIKLEDAFLNYEGCFILQIIFKQILMI